VRHHPAAVLDRLVGHGDEAAIGGLVHGARRLALDDQRHQLPGVALGIGLEERAGRNAQIDQLTHRHAWPHGLAREPVHLDVALVRQQETALGVEHVEALAHIVEGAVDHHVLPAQLLLRPATAAAGEQSGGDYHRRQGDDENEEALHAGPAGADRDRGRRSRKCSSGAN
jgi:hypothetical protein